MPLLLNASSGQMNLADCQILLRVSPGEQLPLLMRATPEHARFCMDVRILLHLTKTDTWVATEMGYQSRIQQIANATSNTI
jgi:hypothetical protein